MINVNQSSRRAASKNQHTALPMPERFWNYTKKDGDCLAWTGCIRKDGYGAFQLNSKSHLAHRIAYQLSSGEDHIALCVLHKCDNRKCVKPSHLFLGSQKDNIADMVSKQRQKGAVGEKHPNSKLNDMDILAIRNSSKGSAILAADYDVARCTIHRIKSRKAWSHI